MIVVVPDMAPADALDGADAAWEKIALYAQLKYAGMAKVGMVSLTVMAKIGPITGVVGNFPLHFGGNVSLHKEILDFKGIQTRGDPSPCDPEKNACCAECGGDFAMLDPMLPMRSGYLSHRVVALARRGQRGRGKLIRVAYCE